jgi:membrane protease YdiL (CAAX protease family)
VIGAFALGFVIVVIGLLVLYGTDKTKLAHLPLIVPLVGQLVAYIPIVIVLLALLPWVARAPLSAIGFRTPSGADILWAIGGAFVMTVVVDAVGGLEQFFHVSVNETAVDLLKKAAGSDAIWFGIVACVAAPFVEELIFRGFVFNAIRRYAPLWLAVTLGGIIFGAAHFDPHSIGAILPLACGGAVLCLVYYLRGVIWVDMLAHALFNALPVTLILVFHQKVS